MRLTEDSFRALARSAPWRFRDLRFTRRDDHGVVEAFLQRPGRLEVRADGRIERLRDEGSPLVQLSFASDGEEDGAAVAEGEEYAAAALTLRPDGLVERRPEEWEMESEDPMYGDYQWVAMLDPVELSHHVTVDDLREEDRLGRRTWWARLAPVVGYEPRCGCCPLLLTEVSEREEAEASDTPWAEWSRGVVYPTAYDVGLDVETGIVTSLTPLDGERPDQAFEVEIAEVTPW